MSRHYPDRKYSNFTSLHVFYDIVAVSRVALSRGKNKKKEHNVSKCKYCYSYIQYVKQCIQLMLSFFQNLSL